MERKLKKDLVGLVGQGSGSHADDVLLDGLITALGPVRIRRVLTATPTPAPDTDTATDAQPRKSKPRLKKLKRRMKEITPLKLVRYLKSRNVATRDVLWNGTRLTERELTENRDWIEELDPEMIRSGYDCSSGDPFLFLTCQVFGVHIRHEFHGVTIHYTDERLVDVDPRGVTLDLKSDRGHMWRSA